MEQTVYGADPENHTVFGELLDPKPELTVLIHAPWVKAIDGHMANLPAFHNLT